MATSLHSAASATRSPWVVAACALALAGCGPVLATRAVAEAQVAIEAAEAARADTLAVYEYTSAVALLDKAREEEGYSEFQAAIDLAARARTRADDARQRALAAPAVAPASEPRP